MFQYGKVEIEHLNTGLSRELWRFWFNEDRAQLVLDEFHFQTRQTKRHKWVSQSKWLRLEKRYSSGSRPFAPEIVKERALNLFIGTLAKNVTVED